MILLLILKMSSVLYLYVLVILSLRNKYIPHYYINKLSMFKFLELLIKTVYRNVLRKWYYSEILFLMFNQCSSPYVDNCADSFLYFPFFFLFLSFLSFFFFVFVLYEAIVCMYITMQYDYVYMYMSGNKIFVLLCYLCILFM